MSEEYGANFITVTDEDGKVVKNADALADRQLINIEAAKGRATARVER